MANIAFVIQIKFANYDRAHGALVSTLMTMIDVKDIFPIRQSVHISMYVPLRPTFSLLQLVFIFDIIAKLEFGIISRKVYVLYLLKGSVRANIFIYGLSRILTTFRW